MYIINVKKLSRVNLKKNMINRKKWTNSKDYINKIDFIKVWSKFYIINN